MTIIGTQFGDRTDEPKGYESDTQCCSICKTYLFWCKIITWRCRTCILIQCHHSEMPHMYFATWLKGRKAVSLYLNNIWKYNYRQGLNFDDIGTVFFDIFYNKVDNNSKQKIYYTCISFVTRNCTKVTTWTPSLAGSQYIIPKYFVPIELEHEYIRCFETKLCEYPWRLSPNTNGDRCAKHNRSQHVTSSPCSLCYVTAMFIA